MPPPPAAVMAAEKAGLEPSAGDMAEKEALQKKIQEIMGRMRKQESAETAPGHKKERILTPAKFGKPAAKAGPASASPGRMNFADIPPAANSEFERSLISSGAKLLSEVRIGESGIDYIAVSDSINIIQAFVSSGSWLASEEAFGGGAPVWFSEEGNAPSPVARALKAKRAVEELIRGKIDLPVKAYACVASGSIVNSLDIGDEWDRLGVKVLKLDSNDAEPNLDSLGAEFPQNAGPEFPEDKMQELIGILEAAESPE
jgi:hypothetical protein